jgi:hypothetical protein
MIRKFKLKLIDILINYNITLNILICIELTGTNSQAKANLNQMKSIKKLSEYKNKNGKNQKNKSLPPFRSLFFSKLEKIKNKY